MVFQRFRSRIGEVINGSVHRFEGRSVWINLGQAEALLMEEDRIPGEHYRPGQVLRSYLYDVIETQGDPRVLVSRSGPLGKIIYEIELLAESMENFLMEPFIVTHVRQERRC